MQVSYFETGRYYAPSNIRGVSKDAVPFHGGDNGDVATRL